ncbi:MAG: cell division protein FtsL [Bacilli bacterium]|jgi:cell division protein FtsL|nr:cell division protein FtsL [Bacilli bacterium]
MSTNVVKKRKKRTGIKLIYLALALVLLAIPVCNVYTKAILSESNIALEEMKSDIKNQEVINESLEMQISELASLDKVQEIADENGLTYVNGNITVVSNG